MAYDHVVFDLNYAGERGAWCHGAVHKVGSGDFEVPRDVAEAMVEAGHGAWMRLDGKKWTRITNPKRARSKT